MLLITSHTSPLTQIGSVATSLGPPRFESERNGHLRAVKGHFPRVLKQLQFHSTECPKSFPLFATLWFSIAVLIETPPWLANLSRSDFQYVCT